MRYDFVDSDGKPHEVECDPDRIAAASLRLEKDWGWKRVWTRPNVIIIPGYWEAKEEADRVADDPWGGNPRMSFEKMMEV